MDLMPEQRLSKEKSEALEGSLQRTKATGPTRSHVFEKLTPRGDAD
jgi:hypothetical protein